MSVGQLTPILGISGDAPKLRILSSQTQLPNPLRLTFMCWACHTGGIDDAYSDLMTLRAPGETWGMGSHTVSGTRRFLMGDELTDIDGPRPIPDDEWHHYAMTAEDTSSTSNRVVGYLDGAEQASGTLVNPVTPNLIALCNSRESDDDPSGVWIGNLCAVKIWTVQLTAEEIRREMWYYMPRKRAGLWACAPMTTVDTRTRNYGGAAGVDWTSLSIYFEQGSSDPESVIWDSFDTMAVNQIIPPPPLDLPWLPRLTNVQGDKGARMISSGFMPPR